MRKSKLNFSQKFIIIFLVLVLCLSGIAIYGLYEKEEKYVPKGYYYPLEKAYAQGLITKNDLLNISYNFSRSFSQYEEGFIPVKYDINDLDIAVANEMKEAKAYEVNESGYPCSAEEIDISGYYGTYNQCVIIIISDPRYGYTTAETNETIGGVEFKYSPPFVIAWVRNA